MMKKYILLTLSFIAVVGVTCAQNILEDYDRLGLSVFLITYGDKYEKDIREALKTISLPERYDKRYEKDIGEALKASSFPDRWDNNMVSPYIIRLPASYENDTIIGWKMFSKRDQKYVDRRKKAIKKFFRENDIGQKIVAKWFNYQPEKGFDLATVYKRAKYNATDEEIKVADASKRGEALIRDYGVQLVNKSHVVVIDIRNIQREINRNPTTVRFQSPEFGSYLYKLKFGEEQINQFYDCWVFEDDTPEEKAEKLERFEQMSFPLDFKQANPDYTLVSISSTKFDRIKNGFQFFTMDGVDTGSRKVRDLVDPTFQLFIQNSLYIAGAYSSKFIGDFRVKTKISNTNPIRAKIGKKENLSIKHKYYVYEYVWNEKQQKAVPKRKGVIRVKKVADNWTRSAGKTKMSTFYQTHGEKIEAGMVMEEQLNYGFSIMGNYYIQANGFSLSLMQRSGSLPALYYKFSWGRSNQKISAEDKNNFSYLGGYSKSSLPFNFLSVGIGKGFNFFRNFEIIPSISFGGESTNWEDVKFNTWAFYPELLLGFRVLPAIQIYGQYHYFGYFGKTAIVTESENNQEDLKETGETWVNEFPRKKTNWSIGLRYSF